MRAQGTFHDQEAGHGSDALEGGNATPDSKPPSEHLPTPRQSRAVMGTEPRECSWGRMPWTPASTLSSPLMCTESILRPQKMPNLDRTNPCKCSSHTYLQ